MPQPPAYRAPSVGRALKILEMVAESQGGLGISDLARRLELSKGTVFGLCRQLEEGGALVRDQASKRYALGPLVATLAGRGFVRARLREAAGPELALLRDQLGESIFLGVLGRNEITVIDTRQPSGVIRIAAGPGTRLPLTAGAVGKVFLAGLTPARLERILEAGLAPYTARAATDRQEYMEQLAQVRRQGYAVEEEEYLPGVWGVAVALGAAGGLPAALWSVGFTSTLAPGRLEQMALALMRSARRIDQALLQAGPGAASTA